MQRNYNKWKEQGRKKGFETWGFNLGSVAILWRSSLTTTTMIGPTSLVSSCNGRKFFVFFFFSKGGGYLGFCFLGFFFFSPQMAPSLCLLSVQNTPYPHCSGPYILGSFLKHVRSVHPLVNLFPRLAKFFFFASFLPSYVSP